jgi:signal transduction histidine kinase
LLVGICALAVIALADTILAPVISQETPHLARIINNTVIILFIAGLYALARYKNHHTAVAIVLTGFITLMSCFMAFHWGLLIPTGLLLFSLAVVMAGILIGARYSLYVACIIVVVMSGLTYGQAKGKLHPDLSWVGTGPTTGDVIGFSAILFVIALVSWLFNRQMELSLKRAQRSEKALQRQRDLLEMKVEKRARQLEKAQLDKMQQLYRFAELGQLSTALFHDLANHLSTVNVDIEGLSGGNQPDIMRRIQQNVGHINDIVRRVRQQIGGKASVGTFDIQDEIQEVVKILEQTAEQASTAITISADKSVQTSLLYKGDATRFRQIILNLVSNGIEAYPSRRPKKAGPKVVGISMERQGTTLHISVNDHGVGLRPANRSKIFNPFYTTKAKGIGIGLFIVKQIVENDFNGIITVDSNSRQGTTFTVSLPKTYYAKIPRR